VIYGSEPISCEIMLHCAIGFLAGGFYHGIRATVHISKASFFRLVWHTIDAINCCEFLDVTLSTLHDLSSLRATFRNISYCGVMDGCVGALDGYLTRITAPSNTECGNVGAYFSGHYCTYGVNVQAMCDADCRFCFFCPAAPGKTNDCVAIKKTCLPAWLESIPPGFCITSDCAYSITEHSIAPFSGPQQFLEKCDNFNFFLSQLHIWIEMAFRLMVTKWRILHTPINVKLLNQKKLLNAIEQLHNYCIDNREPSIPLHRIYKAPANQQQPHEPTQLGYIPSDAPNVISRKGSSHLREISARQVADNNLTGPLTTSLYRAMQHRGLAMYE
jgi:hypothetical protein